MPAHRQIMFDHSVEMLLAALPTLPSSGKEEAG